MKKKDLFLALLPTFFLFVMTVVMLVVHRQFGQPWSGIVAFVNYGGYLLYAFFKKRKVDKQRAQEEAPLTEESETEPERPAMETEGDVPFLLVMNSFSGAIYQMFRGKKAYYLVRVGGELKGVDPDRMLDKCPTETAMAELQGKNVTICKETVQRFKVTMKRAVSTQLPNSGVISFYTPKKKSYLLLFDVTEEQVNRFFSDLRDRTEKNERVHRREKQKNDKNLSLGQWRKENQRPEVMRVLRGVTTGLTVAGVALSLAFYFLPVPYKLTAWVLIGLSFICMALPMVFPAYYSLMRTAEEAKDAEKAPCIGWMYAMMACCAGLMLRGLRDFNFINEWRMFAFGAGIAVIVTIIYILRSRELRGRVGMTLATLFLMFVFSMGIPAELNYLLDNSALQVEKCTVLDMHISTSSKGPTEYNCTVEIDGRQVAIDVGKTAYETIAVGEQVEVGIKNGALGIAYCQLRKME